MGLPAAIAIVVACYALGCVVPSYYAVKWFAGKDLRTTGSGTTGATNAGRVLGRKAYVLLTLLDILKGWGGLKLAALCGLSPWWLVAAGLALVAGHLWPAQLGFHGGKGLSPSYGIILAAAPWVALLMWAVFACAFLLFRSTTLGAVQAFLTAPLLAVGFGARATTLTLLTALAVVVSLTHLPNIRAALQKRAAANPQSPQA
jgi:glycerol-3-phosphate acyltransferase PlsY